MAFTPGRDGDDGVLADINVTPLVDVMLVLLIIFMIAAPMLHQGIEVALPRAQAKNLPLKVEDPIVLSINRDGQIYLRETPVPTADLVDRLKAQLQARPDDTVFLKGDRDAPYGRVVDVLDILQRGGIQHVGMVTERPEKGRRH
ncbi:MAG TPA: protein TolR [Thermoanaerobaculia bacterium]|nr:protein TolR [Thermoanaerobaculia bacterium]